ncbi:hypothetical protein [Flavobacterium sp. FlaQc-50]|uniref:hypothetical protein n=1 Tax=unclassified Flavobacterium TaxID=196869 RepID=UPI003756D23C
MESFEKSLEKELNYLNSFLDNQISIGLLVHFIRTLDYLFIGNYDQKEKWDLYMDYGFSQILNRVYQKLDINYDFLSKFQTNQSDFDYCFNNLKSYGQYRMVERFSEMNFQNLATIKIKKPEEYIVEVDSNLVATDKYEMTQFESYFQEKQNLYDNSSEKAEYWNKKIKDKFKKKVFIGKFNYIGYDSTPEIDDHYNIKGNIHLNTSQLFDDFDENFEFGGIPYKQHVTVVQSLMGVALKHVDACSILNESKDINVIDLLPTCDIQETIIDQYSDYLQIPINNIREIFNLLTVTPENIHHYLKADKSFSPPFIKISNLYTLRSIKGCLYHPITFLQKSLSIKYSADYSRGLNMREDIFRNELYSLFEEERIIKINRSVKIKIKNEGIDTDIDAALFDPKSKHLALIQLKWQDKYSTNLKERNSRSKNLCSMANEWVNKIVRWKDITNQKEILNALGIYEYKNFNNCSIFVIGRYNTHFSDKEINENATWGSWYHILALNKLKLTLDDPIMELKLKLETDSPRSKNINIAEEEISLHTFKVECKTKP